MSNQPNPNIPPLVSKQYRPKKYTFSMILLQILNCSSGRFSNLHYMMKHTSRRYINRVTISTCESNAQQGFDIVLIFQTFRSTCYIHLVIMYYKKICWFCSQETPFIHENHSIQCFGSAIQNSPLDPNFRGHVLGDFNLINHQFPWNTCLYIIRVHQTNVEQDSFVVHCLQFYKGFQNSYLVTKK